MHVHKIKNALGNCCAMYIVYTCEKVKAAVSDYTDVELVYLREPSIADYTEIELVYSRGDDSLPDAGTSPFAILASNLIRQCDTDKIEIQGKTRSRKSLKQVKKVKAVVTDYTDVELVYLREAVIADYTYADLVYLRDEQTLLNTIRA